MKGLDFVAGATVTVGGLPATDVNVTDVHTLTMKTPNLPAGSISAVTVQNPGGGLSGTLPNGWIVDFLDVPGNNQFYLYVTRLVAGGITAGVGNGFYGVTQGTLRQQMAVFLLKARLGVCYTPPPCSGTFPDVPCSNNFAPWIEALAAARHHGRLRGRQLLPRQRRDAPADGGVPVEGQARLAVRAASLRGPLCATCRARRSSPTGSSSCRRRA